jgi:hypothetical protein
MSRLPPVLLALGLALGAAGCAPTLRFNQSFLTAEEIRVSDRGFASLKSTGETFDFTPLRTLEGKVDRVILLKVHGTWFVTGEGFRHVYRLWPGGDDEAHYKPIEIEKSPVGGFSAPALEPAGKCALFSWTTGGGTEKRWLTAGGDVESKGCPDA